MGRPVDAAAERGDVGPAVAVEIARDHLGPAEVVDALACVDATSPAGATGGSS